MASEKRLIDANAFIEDIKTEIVELWLNGLKGTPQPTDQLYDIINRIGEQPTVDAVEVVHGRWRWRGEDRFNDAYSCSICGKIAMDDSNFCPNCGAKMDVERKDGE